jgi:hypothetical protein
VEFVAAITWLAELFPDQGRKERVLGWTQAFASIGGLVVTMVNGWILKHAAGLPALPLSEPFNSHADWRYTLITGLLPAIPIALLLPFVPESRIWREKQLAGMLRRPSLGELFAPALRRTTLVTAGLSACAYGIAFGALQLTPTRIVPGLADLAEQRRVLGPLQEEAAQLNRQLDEVRPRFEQACAEASGLRALAGQRARIRIALRSNRAALDGTGLPETKRIEIQNTLESLTNKLSELDGQLNQLAATRPEAKKVLMEREKILGQLASNREKQARPDTIVKTRGKDVQLWQESGGLIGRMALAALLTVAISRRTLLRLFQAPGILVIPATYLWLFPDHPELFRWGMLLAGLLTVAQFSYFGEYLPKIFPLHLRGTGGSFATNVGGRMLGTSAAFITTNVVAREMLGGTGPTEVAVAAAIVGTVMFLAGLVLSIFLPEPKRDPGI